MHKNSIYKNFDWNVFKNRKFWGETFNNWPRELLGTNVYKNLEFCW